jgi:hypothetical protein
MFRKHHHHSARSINTVNGYRNSYMFLLGTHLLSTTDLSGQGDEEAKDEGILSKSQGREGGCRCTLRKDSLQTGQFPIAREEGLFQQD